MSNKFNFFVYVLIFVSVCAFGYGMYTKDILIILSSAFASCVFGSIGLLSQEMTKRIKAVEDVE